MESWQYFATLIVTFLGLFVGMFLAYRVREELPLIRKWLVLVRFGLFMIVCLASFLAYDIPFLISLFMLLMVASTIYHIKVPDFIIYAALGFIFYVSSRIEFLFLMNSVLVFAIGLPIGTLITEELRTHKKMKIFWRLFLHNMVYVLFAGLLYLLI